MLFEYRVFANRIAFNRLKPDSSSKLSQCGDNDGVSREDRINEVVLTRQAILAECDRSIPARTIDSTGQKMGGPGFEPVAYSHDTSEVLELRGAEAGALAFSDPD